MASNKYYRIFTDLFPRLTKEAMFDIKLARKDIQKFVILYLALCSFVLLAFSIYLFQVYSSIKKERQVLLGRLEYWEKIVKEHPNFPDAFYEVSYYSLMLGDKKKALENIDKAIFLDPGFKEAEDLRLEIQK